MAVFIVNKEDIDPTILKRHNTFIVEGNTAIEVDSTSEDYPKLKEVALEELDRTDD